VGLSENGHRREAHKWLDSVEREALGECIVRFANQGCCQTSEASSRNWCHMRDGFRLAASPRDRYISSHCTLILSEEEGPAPGLTTTRVAAPGWTRSVAGIAMDKCVGSIIRVNR
jgi:hypothetical protein